MCDDCLVPDVIPERLSPLDASFRYAEGGKAPLHIATVTVLQPPAAGFNYEEFVALVQRRLVLAPRFRQLVLDVPFNLARPVWVDDPRFDLSFHVRRAALPRPGDFTQLRELVARLTARPLDDSRPLWESYFVEGLGGGAIAIVTKTDPALLDGGTADLTQLLVNEVPLPRPTVPAPRSRVPTGSELAAVAVAEMMVAPVKLLADLASEGGVTQAAARTKAVLASWVSSARGVISAVATAARPAPVLPLNTDIGRHRRVAFIEIELERLRAIRNTHGGRVNDVVLAAIAGGLRQFLLSRRFPVENSTVVRAMVPLGIRSTAGASQVAPHLVDLPVGEANPLMRLREISHSMATHTETGQFLQATTLVGLSGLAGFAPPTLHALGIRAALRASRRLFNLVITNVPGPQTQLKAGDAVITAVYPVVPLVEGQALSIGVTSYNGTFFIGLNADRDAIGDVAALARMMEETVAELEAE